MKKTLAFLTLCICILITALTACGTPGGVSSTPSGTGSTPPAQSTEEAPVQDRSAMLGAYRAVLEGFLYERTLPGRDPLPKDEVLDMEQNKFAVCDIDRDGSDELIIVFTTSYMAAMEIVIYDFDSSSGAVREQFSEFPSLTFYDNGVIEAAASHNHGMAPERFWPYTLYQYDPEADEYVQIAILDAWEKEHYPKDYNGVPFPDGIDADGDGMVYFIMTDGKYEPNTPVDLAEYESWCSSFTDGAQPISVPYLSLTEESIQSIR